MALTTIADLQIVPEKFAAYVNDTTTEKSILVNSGIATPDSIVAGLINGTPKGGRFINFPMYNPLEGEEEVFGEEEIGIDKITTKEARATLLIRQKAWGDTDLARVLGGTDPLRAIMDQTVAWRNIREQQVYLSILKGILDPTSGALKSHVNDVSKLSGEAALISVGNTLDTKQALGDAAGILGMVVMHSATYTELQKNQQIATEYDATLQISIQTYLGYRVLVDDSMPWIGYTAAESSASGAIAVTTANIAEIQPHCATELTAGTSYVTKDANPVYDTYFLGTGAFIRQNGVPAGLVEAETVRDPFTSSNYIFSRWCQVIHPRGLSWVSNGTYTNATDKYPANVDLASPANWELISDHKKIGIACLRHKLS